MTGGGRWVATWTAAPQLTEPDNLPPAAFITDGVAFADCTLRQTIRVSAGGGRIRLRFSNAFGATDLVLDRVSIALPRGGRAGVPEIADGTSRAVTFGGRPSVTVRAGTQAVSDPLDFPAAAGANMTVTAYLPVGQPAAGGVTSHPGSRTTSYLAAGKHHDFPERTGLTPVDHWYCLCCAEVRSESAGVLITLGDSLTDGRGSTTNGNDRWPDQLFNRLRSGRPVPGDPVSGQGAVGIAIVNQGIGGNRVLRDGLGPGALARLDTDVLAVSGARWLIVFEGVNDIGTAEATSGACERVAADLVFAYEQIIVRAHAAGMAVYGATLTPLGGNEAYDDPGGHREAARQAVNDWILGGRRPGGGSGPRFDAVVDFDAAVRDPSRAGRLRAAFDTGDHLHLNPAGYAALAAAVPAGLFAPARRS